MTITVYVKENCPPCKMLKRKLDELGVAYVEESAVDNTEYLATLGYRGAPVTVTAEGEHFHGYIPDKIKQLAGAS